MIENGRCQRRQAEVLLRLCGIQNPEARSRKRNHQLVGHSITPSESGQDRRSQISEDRAAILAPVIEQQVNNMLFISSGLNARQSTHIIKMFLAWGLNEPAARREAFASYGAPCQSGYRLQVTGYKSRVTSYRLDPSPGRASDRRRQLATRNL
jgi:hypothetical protein